MFCRSICWFICTFVAVAIVTGYSGQYFNAESSTSGPDQEVRSSTAVNLGALLDAGEGTVVILVAGDTRLAAHRAVLSARSAVFQRLLQDSSTGEVAVPDVEGPVLRQLLAYLYTLQAPQLPAMAPQLLAAAHQYGLPALKADCEQQVAKQLSVETAVATAVLAVRHSCDSLRKASIDYIRTHIFHVMATQGWADAINTQPQVMIKVMELLSQSPAETSSSGPAESGSSTYHATQPHSDYSGNQTATTVAPTTVAQTITQTDDDDICFWRNLSVEEKTRRLMEAAEQGAVGELEALLAAGADVAARDSKRWSTTALHWAAMNGHEEAARLLLAEGAAVDARDYWQWTPLHCAAHYGRAVVVRLLLENGADHGARDDNGRTPLHLAATYGRREAAAALLEAGADRAARDNEGNTPLYYARRRNHQQLVQLLEGSSPTAGIRRK